MVKSDEICFMKARLIRLASAEWNKSIVETIDIFDKNKILEYIEKNYDIFHVEGDYAIFDDIKKYMQNIGSDIND